MKHFLLAASLAALLVSALPADAKNGHGRGHGGDDHHGHDEGHPPGKHKGWHKKYRRGEHLEPVYLERRYYVDHHHYDLPPPPHGHRWVRHPDGRMIMVAIATGIIADILLHH